MAKTVSTQKGLELELQRRINLALNGGASRKYMSAAARAKGHWKPTAAW